MADSNLQKDTAVSNSTTTDSITVEKAIYYMQNGTGQGTDKNGNPITTDMSVVTVKRKTSSDMANGILNIFKDPFTPEELEFVKKVSQLQKTRQLGDLLDRYFFHDIAEVCLADNVEYMVETKKMAEQQAKLKIS